MVSYRDKMRESERQKWKEKRKGNGGNPPLSHISNNPDTNRVS